MAKYDPQRPRPVAYDDDVAPVDALLDHTIAGAVDDDSVGSTAGDEPNPVVPTARDEPNPVEPTTVDEPNRTVSVDGTHLPGAVSASGEATVIGDRLGSGSDVPVVAAPAGGTVNRAVLGAVVVALVSIVTTILVVRRRRRD